MPPPPPLPARALRLEYLHLYRAGLRAVQFSKPARYDLRDILRRAFRQSPASDYDAQRVANTIAFLQSAARRRGMEHKVVKNLLFMAYWRRTLAGKPSFDTRKLNAPQRYSHQLRQQTYANVETTLQMLNATTNIDLRI